MTTDKAVDRRRLLFWALVGFVTPIFWGVMSAVLFTARESIWTDAYWYLVYASCPVWLLPTNTATTVLMPVLNAGLYGGIAFLLTGNQRRSAPARTPKS
jgi:hypothetical protein